MGWTEEQKEATVDLKGDTQQLLLARPLHLAAIYWQFFSMSRVYNPGSGVCVCVCETERHLDHSEKALIGGGVCGDGEAPGGVPRHDAVNGAPGLCVRLVFVRHREISNNHVDTVLINVPGELRERRKRRRKG